MKKVKIKYLFLEKIKMSSEVTLLLSEIVWIKWEKKTKQKGNMIMCQEKLNGAP